MKLRWTLWVFLSVVAIFCVFVFLQRRTTYTARVREIESAARRHGWADFMQLIPSESVNGPIEPSKIRAFLDYYLPPTKELVMREEEIVGGVIVRIDLKDAKPIFVNKGPRPLQTSLIEIKISRKANRIPFFPRVAEVDFEFSRTFAALAWLRFPDTMAFNRQPKNSNFLAAQYLFALAEHDRLVGFGFTRKATSPDWCIEDIEENVGRDLSSFGWDTAALFDHYHMKAPSDSKNKTGA